MDMVISEYDDSEIGAVKFATYKQYDDHYTKWIRDDWKVEPVTLLGCAILSDGEPFIDLGANIGAFCIPLAIKKRSPFLAVEALRDNAELLRIAIQENGIENANIAIAAILDGEKIVHVKGHSAYGTVNEYGEGVTVEAVTGDKLFHKFGFENARLVKIDIEGAELKALEGMEEFVSMDISRSYIFEGNGAHAYDSGYAPSDIVRVFEKLGYEVYMIVGRKLVPYRSDDLQPFGLINYLAIPRLPVELDYGFRVMRLNENEIVAGVVRALTQMKTGYRSFMLQELEKAPSSISTDQRVLQCVANTSR